MIKLVVGTKGKGKTKYLLESANAAAKVSDGVVIYLDKNSEHIFQLDRAIRLINVREYRVNSLDVLFGFMCGLKAGNSDIETMYLDGFMAQAGLQAEDLAAALPRLKALSERLETEFIVSLSVDISQLPEEFKEYVVLSL